MPAPAVIPAPLAYNSAAAVKTLVVPNRRSKPDVPATVCRLEVATRLAAQLLLSEWFAAPVTFTVIKEDCPKKVYA